MKVEVFFLLTVYPVVKQTFTIIADVSYYS